MQEDIGSSKESTSQYGGRPTVQVKVKALSGAATVAVPAGATQEELRVLVEEATGVDASRQVLLRRLGDGPLTDLRMGEVITLEVDGGTDYDGIYDDMVPVGTSAASFARMASAADMCAGPAEHHAPPEVCPEAKSGSGSIDLAGWSPQRRVESTTVLHWVGHAAVEGLAPGDALLGGGALLAEISPGHLQRAAPAIDLATSPGSYMELLATGANSIGNFMVEWPDQRPGPDFFDASSAFTVELWVQVGEGTTTPGTLLGKCGPAAGWEIRQLQDTLQFSVVLQTGGRSWRHTVEQRLCGGSFHEPPVHVAAILDGHRLRLFVNGDESGTRQRPDVGWNTQGVGPDAEPVPWRPWYGALSIGRHPCHADRSCACRIFALRLVHEVLSPSAFMPCPVPRPT